MSLIARPFIQFARAVTSRVLYYSGALRIIGFVRQRFGTPCIIVPMYHRVRGHREPDAHLLLPIQYGLCADLFERHLRIFKWFGPIVTLRDAHQAVDDPHCPRVQVAITFDDGYLDNYTVAFPLLKKYGATATIFPVVRTCSGGRMLWWDEVAAVIHFASEHKLSISSIIEGIPELSSVHTELIDSHELSFGSVAASICDQLTHLPCERRNAILDLMSKDVDVGNGDSEERCYAMWHELQEMEDYGIEIGGHTIDHPVLTSEESNEATRQISQSRETLSQIFTNPIDSFAYPNGAHDETAWRALRESGFVRAVTTGHGLNFAHSDSLQLKRMPVGQEEPHDIAFKLAFYGFAHPSEI